MPDILEGSHECKDDVSLMKKLGLGIEEGKFGIINAEHIWKNT